VTAHVLYFVQDLFEDIRVLFRVYFWPVPKSRCAHRRHVRSNSREVSHSHILMFMLFAGLFTYVFALQKLLLQHTRRLYSNFGSKKLCFVATGGDSQKCKQLAGPRCPYISLYLHHSAGNMIYAVPVLHKLHTSRAMTLCEARAESADLKSRKPLR